jgi:glycosyltransferase involved in cell wall biosynthesis
MRIALFTHNFLEPTHYAIAAVLRMLTEHQFTVFAKRFLENDTTATVPNVVARVTYVKGCTVGLTPDHFDLVHAIYDGEIVFPAAEHAFRAGLPFILSFHGGFDIKVKVFDPQYADSTLQVAERATAVTVPSVSDVARLRRLGVRRPIEVVPVPIDPSILPPARPLDPRRLVCIARLIPRKGVDVALLALRQLPKYFLEVVGDGPLRDSLERLAERLGIRQRVYFWGILPLRETLARLAGAGALLHPARVVDGDAEGIPQVILWAQAMGVPVITTPTGSIPDIVCDGENGLFVPPNDVNALVEAVLRLETQPGLRERITTMGRRVVESHRLELVVTQVRQIYKQACTMELENINRKS